MEVKIIGNLYPENPHQSGNVFDSNGLSNTIMAGTHGYGFGQILEVTKVFAYDEQNQNVRYETIGTLTTDGSSPKHNNRIIEIRKVDTMYERSTIPSRAEQSRAEQSRAEQSSLMYVA